MTTMEIRSLLPRLVGGDEGRFFREYWRKQTLFTEAAVPEFRSLCDYDRFLTDYRRLDFHEATLLIRVNERGRREMSRPVKATAVDEALALGMSVVLRGLWLPQLRDLPQAWRVLLDLYDGLCAYLLPTFPARGDLGGAVAAIDIFCTSAETSIGGHYDTGDVFYFVLDGEKEWTVELVPDTERGYELAADGSNYLFDRAPLKDYMTVSVKPGDCLYVPPFTYHRVRSTGRSLAVSFGLPTFTAVTLVRGALSHVQEQGLLFDPLPSFPRTQGALFREAREEVRRRTLGVLNLLREPLGTEDSAPTASPPRRGDAALTP
jgi:ribosomal protein L16 Arg81 hydroxylase